MGKGKSQTIGFHYYFSILFGLSRGPVNSLVGIKVGDKVAWEGEHCLDTANSINKPNLFGGEEKEGGIQGPFRLQRGAANQVIPGDEVVNVSSPVTSSNDWIAFAQKAMQGPYGGPRTLLDLKQTILAATGALVSEMRGVTTLYFDGLISSMNPYPKEWKFRLRRTTAGWDGATWYHAKATIYLDGIHAMNAAHIIYECSTNRSWGRGLPREMIDENSFIYAANLFCDEGMGLCLLWTRKEDIDAFVQTVLDHVGAVVYTDPESGLLTLRAIRGDYVVADLPLFSPGNGLIDITEDDNASQDLAFNEVIGTGHDPKTDEDFQLRVHNLAARHSHGAPNADSKPYPGFPTKELLSRAIQRDLRVHSSGLTKLRVTLDRAGYLLRPGMCFRVSDPRRGIAEMVLRVGEVNDNPANDGHIEVAAMQDVYSLPTTSFVTPTESTWQAPAQEALPPLDKRLIEVGYRDAQRISGDQAATVSDTDSYIGQLAVAPNAVSYQYEFLTRAAGETKFTLGPVSTFTGNAKLAAALKPLDTEATLTDYASFGADNVGEALLMGDEVVELVAFDAATNVATLKRGCADTIPAAHAIGVRLWTADDDLAFDGRKYAVGETVESLVLTRTASDVLEPQETAPEQIVVSGRVARPYPPGNVKVDGTSVYALTQPEYESPVLTWTHRDRLLQEDQLVGHLDGSVGPEAGTTYRLRIYGADGTTLLRTVPDLTEPTWAYDGAAQTVDGGQSTVYVELESVREGLASWQHYRFRLPLKSGYGYGYGYNYGGA